MLISMYPSRRSAGVAFLIFVVVALWVGSKGAGAVVDSINEKVIRPGANAVKNLLPGKGKNKSKEDPHPTYKPTPTYTPPPIEDPFPLLLATSTPPPIPPWNVARESLHREYGLATAPPLLIGFTRTWPLLLQAVVSYIAAGWPPSQIYVVENTGVQQANRRGQLTLQNPFYLNHTTLGRLGVNVVQTPTLLSFAQLQNFFLSMTYERGWPFYFWSHMDVLALSYEDGLDGVTPPAGQPGYKTVYELCLRTLAETLASDPRWALRFFAYDHLALVNPRAYEDVGGWDTLIPYYMTDCDMHSRLAMANWSAIESKAGIITDVNTALQDLRALYRDKSVRPAFVDPNPPPPPPPNKDAKRDKGSSRHRRERMEDSAAEPDTEGEAEQPDDGELEYWRALQKVADTMFHYKHGDRGRNTWQLGQKGGFAEPFHYPAEGLAEGLEVITEAGREVYRRKWGHRECDLITGAGLRLWDQWRVEQDWD